MRCQTEQEDTNIFDTLDLSSRCRGCHWSKKQQLVQTIKFSICASVRKKLLFNSVFIFLQQEHDTSDDGVTSGRFVGLFITHTRELIIFYMSLFCFTIFKTQWDNL